MHPNKPHHNFEPALSKSSFEIIRNKAESKGLKINDSKTQILSVSSGNYTTEATIKTSQGDTLTSGQSLKMLGFTLSNEPTVSKQVDTLKK